MRLERRDLTPHQLAWARRARLEACRISCRWGSPWLGRRGNSISSKSLQSDPSMLMMNV
jgi:hypothetical protein